MNTLTRTVLATATLTIAMQATAQVVFYEHDNFEGRSYSTDRALDNFERSRFNDRASSVVVLSDRWEACEDSQYRGRCVVLRPGRYPSLAAMGLNDRVSSVRIVGHNATVEDNRYAPEAESVYDNHRRNRERLYQADVTSVHAVGGPREQRCWTESQPVARERGGANVPGAILGAVVGGVLGHQIGGGSGKDIATAGGAVVGAAVGANAGRDHGGQRDYSQNVQRCESVTSQGRPDYWDVTYSFRGQEHRMQVTNPPGSTVTVNRDGEPRA
jgi:uncharacterized protein YcfJ